MRVAIASIQVVGVRYRVENVDTAVDFAATRPDSPWATTPHRPS
jgi:hypothetical protein